MKKLKSSKGITLMALVITIIVLLILAAITMSMVLGENGLIGKAQTAANDWERTQEEEEARANNLLGGTGTPTITGPTEKTEIQFEKLYGAIEIVWLDTNNNVISAPMSPAKYLGGLIPVKWTGTPGNYTEVATDTTDTDWYSYTAQTGTTENVGTSRWANAKTSDENAYFVWIPRYAYKITYFASEANKEAYRADNTSTTGIIGYSTIYGMVDVTEGTPKLVEGTKPTNVTGRVKTSEANMEYVDYIPHPAFEFGGAKAGIWVGKYQSSGTLSAITIKPNVAAIRGKPVDLMFTYIQGVKTKYGLSGDTHMIKNTEWGVVTYLTESKYGRNGTGISINTNSSYITGISSGSTTSQTSVSGGDYVYNGTIGVTASTTRNIYGVYDMAGFYVSVAAFVNNETAKSSSDMTDLYNADSKYKDVYSVGSDNSGNQNYFANKGMRGDATYETSSGMGTPNNKAWHNERFWYPADTMPMFDRGIKGSASEIGEKGPFRLMYGTPGIEATRGCRVVFTPNGI